MEKDKIILKDNTSLEINQSSGTDEFIMNFSNLTEFMEILTMLTASNLESYQVQNQDGLTVARPENKECLHTGIDLTWDKNDTIINVKATFSISDVDMISKRLEALEETTDALVMESLIGGEVL